jgi:hypothetical protein
LKPFSYVDSMVNQSMQNPLLGGLRMEECRG